MILIPMPILFNNSSGKGDIPKWFFWVCMFLLFGGLATILAVSLFGCKKEPKQTNFTLADFPHDIRPGEVPAMTFISDKNGLHPSIPTEGTDPNCIKIIQSGIGELDMGFVIDPNCLLITSKDSCTFAGIGDEDALVRYETEYADIVLCNGIDIDTVEITIIEPNVLTCNATEEELWTAFYNILLEFRKHDVNRKYHLTYPPAKVGEVKVKFAEPKPDNTWFVEDYWPEDIIFSNAEPIKGDQK